MSGSLLVLFAVLAGQVNSTNDRYGTAGQNQVGGNSQAAPPAANGLVPILEPPPADSRTRPNAAPPTQRNADPYNAPLSARGGNQPSPFDGNATSPSTSAPPPGFGGFRSQTSPPQNSPPPATVPAIVKPSALMRSMLTAPSTSRLSGEPVALAEVLASATSRAEQSQRIEAYWDLCSSVADYYLGLGEQEELRRLRSTVPRIGPTWEQAEKELGVRIGTSERAARASQHRLASSGGYSGSLPLPADMPHCGNYRSRYDEIFAGRPSTEAQELSALFPLRYAELKDAAMGVTRAGEWLSAIATNRNEESDGTATLRALELWALRRRAFVQIARDYNRRIARYSELATPGQVPADRLVGMLILRDSSSTATRSSNPAQPPNRQSNDDARFVPNTFSGGWSPAATGAGEDMTRDEAVKPAAAEARDQPRQERSLLVKPKWDH